MLLNGSILNGSVLNGSNKGIFGSSASTCGAVLVAAALILKVASCSVPASGAIVLANVYGADYAFSTISARSNIYIQSTAYVRKDPGLVGINGSAALSLSPEQKHLAGAEVSGSAVLAPFQGDAAIFSGTATVDPTAQAGRDTYAYANGGYAVLTATAILYADGVKPLAGKATVDAVPSVQYDPDTFLTHDGHTRIKSSGTLLPPIDPLHKVAVIENGGFKGGSTTVSNTTVAHFARSISACKATVKSSPVLDLYHQASILTPKATITASPYLLKSNGQPVIFKGNSTCYFSVYVRSLPRIKPVGTANILASAGRLRATSTSLITKASVIADAFISLGIESSIHGSVNVLASMISNPRAHAAGIRTLVMTEDNRLVIVSSENRTITLRSS